MPSMLERVLGPAEVYRVAESRAAAEAKGLVELSLLSLALLPPLLPLRPRLPPLPLLLLPLAMLTEARVGQASLPAPCSWCCT